MRLLGDDALAELGRDPVERVADALARGDDATASELADRARRAWARGIDGFRVWIVHTLAFLTEHVGTAAADRAQDAVTRATAAWEPWSAEVVAAPRDEPVLDALVADAHAARDEHDRGLDALCALLTHVYRTHGVDVLAASIAHAGDRTLLAWMPTDLARDPVARVRTWVAMLQGNFATVRVDEDDRAFVITQDPCGSCGRQLAAGRHPGPFDHATVTEVHPITFDRGDVGVYRTHVAVMHFLVPEARIGVPWPVVACPRGDRAGPCVVRLYKDPLDPAAHTDATTIRRRVEEIDHEPDPLDPAARTDATTIRRRGEEIDHDPDPLDPAARTDATTLRRRGEEIDHEPDPLDPAARTDATTRRGH